MAKKNPKFIRDDPGLSAGGVIFLVVAVMVIFGALGYFFFFHGDSIKIPTEDQIIQAQKAQSKNNGYS